MNLKELKIIVILIVIDIINVDCTYSKPNNYSIGFENFNRVNESGHSSSIGFENVHHRVGGNNQTSGHKPGRYVTTTPSHRRPPITTMRPSKAKATKTPVRHVPTMKPPRTNVTPRPLMPKPSSSRRPIITTRKTSPTLRPKYPTVTHKPIKPKATHPTTKKPTIPTLPPSIYVKPDITKVVLPPMNSAIWSYHPPPPTWIPLVTNTSISSREPALLPTTIAPNYNLENLNIDFRIFFDYLLDFTKKREHTKKNLYQRHKGDTFTYYYQISNYYYNRHLASSFYKVNVNGLKNCVTNTTQIMCLPNTNALCLTNGTMMCVTHFSATILCENGTNYCAITQLPCDVKYQTCATSDKFYAGVPCVSKIVLLPSTDDFYQQITISPMEYCVSSVIQPKRLYSAVGSYLSFVVESAKKQYESIKQNMYKFGNVISQVT